MIADRSVGQVQFFRQNHGRWCRYRGSARHHSCHFEDSDAQALHLSDLQMRRVRAAGLVKR
jgi:hypothetical protein